MVLNNSQRVYILEQHRHDGTQLDFVPIILASSYLWQVSYQHNSSKFTLKQKIRKIIYKRKKFFSLVSFGTQEFILEGESQH